MKYVALIIGYLIMWCLLLIYLIIERLVKLLFIIIQILWYFKIKKKWLSMLNKYSVYIVLLHWETKGLRNYFLMKKFSEIH